MCEPMTIIAATTAAVSAAGTLMEFTAGQAKHHEQVRSANANYAQEWNASQQEASQLSEQESEQGLSDAVAAARSYGTIAASAGTMGIGGYSLSNIIGSDATANQRTTAINTANFAGKRAAIGTKIEGAQIERNSQIRKAEMEKPNLATLALGLGKAGTKGASSYMGMGGKF